MDERLDLLIAGAGAAGLAHAFWRQRAEPGLRLLVAEASPRAGGWVRTQQLDGYTCESGPLGFRPNADTDALIEALALGDEVVPASPLAKRRWLLLDGRLQRLPGGLLQFLSSPMLSLRDKLKVCGEPWRRRGDDPEESMAAFVTRRFGPGLRPLAEALAHGIFAGDADRLEMRSMFPQAVALEQQHGSVVRGLLRRQRPRPRLPRRSPLCTFRGGMSASTAALQRALGPALALCTAVRGLAVDGDGWAVTLVGDAPAVVRARQVALAIPAPAASSLLGGLDPALASDLQSIKGAGVVSVFVGGKRADFGHPLDGFGCLLPRHGGPLLGVLLCSSVFPMHAPEGHALLRVMIGGADHGKQLDRSDAQLTALAVQTCRQLFGLRAEPSFVHVERCRDAIAQYEPGHARRLQRIASALEQHRGLSLLGASYRQIAVGGQWSAAGSHP
jgi:oxygen-dependent protoporphyrinogen oxidase